MRELGAIGLATLAAAGSATLRPEDPERDARDRTALFHLEEAGCLVCHRPGDADVSRLRPVEAPRLERVGARLAPDWLRAFLRDPHGVKSDTRMPDLLAAFDRDAREEAVETLAHFLVSLGGPMDPEAHAASVFAAELEEGRQLFHEVGCVQCHPPVEPAWRLEYTLAELAADASLELGEAPLSDEGVPPRNRIPLAHLASRTSVPALAEFLLDPLAVRPSGRMPSLGLTPGEAGDVARYLLREQAGAGLSAFPGLLYEYFEAPFQTEVPDFDALAPVRIGATARPVLPDPPERREDHFGFRFHGSLRVDVPGSYTFATTSDDGSRLWIDGELVVSNTGFHAMDEKRGSIDLEPGEHALTITCFERDGGEGLLVHWEGPGFAKEELPAERLSHLAASLAPPGLAGFRLDPKAVEEGRRLFRLVGCGSCHATGDAELDAHEPMDAPGLGVLARAEDDGCLSPTVRPGRPRFGPTVPAADLRELLAHPERLAELAAPAQRVAETLARFRCDACHSRAGVGGPAPGRRSYFWVLGEADLGDEGRIPPELDEPGTKLRFEWLTRVLDEGARARPYMATRMPRFGAENLAGLAELLREVDARPGDDQAPPFSMQAVEHGRRLTGTQGLGCIQCHLFAGRDSLGVPAVDLAELTDRLRPQWFHRLLLDPVELNLNTRMPAFWVDGKSPVADVLDGDPDAQIDALWSYFSLASAMPLPDGLVVPDAAYELVPRDRPLLCAVFMRDVGPRTLVVGFPEHTHYAFDLAGSRLAKVWRGRFFNARGTWEGRAGELELPPGADVLDLPAGPTFARLGTRDDPWPVHSETLLPRSLGRVFDQERRPLFRYALGEVEVTERIRPEITADGTRMVRSFRLRAPERADDLWFNGATGRRRVEFRPATDGGWEATLEEVITW